MTTEFPCALTALPHWLCWRYEKDPKSEKDRKVPYNPKTGKRASSTNPNQWANFDTAQEAHQQYMYNGLGFVFTREAGIVGVDVDHCIDPDTGALNEIVTAILAKVPATYIELSPSGTGLHIFLRGTMPEKGNKNEKSGVEMYAHSRFFTMTGKRYGDCPMEIAEDNGALAWIHATYIIVPRKAKKVKKKAGEPLSDEEILEKARSAANGPAFAVLWEGRWQENYASQSEADMALCCKLAFWSGKNREQVDRLFRQSGLLREKWDERHHASGATYGEETITRALDAVEEGYGAKGDAPVFEYEGRYFRAKGDNIYPLTNFVVQPIEMFISDDETQMSADLVTVRGEVFRLSFLTTDFSNLQRFKNLLNKRTIALSYTGSESDLELLKSFIAELDWTRKTGVKAQGMYWLDGRWVYAAQDGAMEARSKPVDNVIQLERCKGLQSSMHRQAAIGKEKLQALGPLLLNYNEPAKTVSVLAWTAGCFIKPHLRRAGIKFPHLFLIGEAGSGKSNTLERVILPIFSQSKVSAATQVTGFTLMQESASSNLVPQPLDEFKPSKIDRNKLSWLYNHFRDSYDGHQGQRGRADQTIVYYDLLAPLVVAGEESPDEAAIRERGIELLFSRKDLKPEERRTAFGRLCAAPEMLAGFGRALLEVALRTDAAEAERWHRDALGAFDKALPSRIVNNLAYCVAGLRLIEKLCVLQGLSWEAVFDLSMDACLRYLAYAAREYLLDGNTANRGIVEQSLEIMAQMGLDKGTECRVNQQRTRVYLNVKRVYDKYTKYRRDHAITGECLDYRQFIKQLRGSDLYIDYLPFRFDDGPARAFVLDYPLLLERCDIESLDSTAVEPLE